MKKIKIGVIGCGRIGSRHAEKITSLDEFELIGVCDIEIDKARELGEKYATNFTDDLEKLIALKPDIIAVCTPNGLHYKHSKLILCSNINVLCEKPVTLKSNESLDLINLAEKNNTRLFAVKQNRFNPPIQVLKDTIEKGQIGKLLSFQLSCFWNRNENYYENSWKGSLDLDGGTLYTQFSHFLDLILWLFGNFKETNGYFDNNNHHETIEFEDTGVVIIRMENGMIGTINYTVNAFESNMEGSLTIFGSNGTIKIGGQYLNEIEYWKVKDVEIPILKKGNKANSYGHYQGSMSNHLEVYQNLIDVLKRNKSINTTSLEAFKTVSLIESIYKERS